MSTSLSRSRHRRHSSHPGFSHLLTSVLGSPFLTTADLPELVDGAPLVVPHAHTVTRPPSPTPTIDSSSFSFVQFDPNASIPNRSPLKSILPRIWDVLSPPRPPIYSFSYSHGSNKMRSSSRFLDESIDYSELEPLDGEEGELIAVDDEACFFIDSACGSRAVTGIDIITLLPPELALDIFVHISPAPEGLQTILTCGAVSHTWRVLSTDNTVWRALFLARWNVDLNRHRRSIVSPGPTILRRKDPEPVTPPRQITAEIGKPKKKRKTRRLFSNNSSSNNSSSSSPSSSSAQLSRPLPRNFFAGIHQHQHPSSLVSGSGLETSPYHPSDLFTPFIPKHRKSPKHAPLQLDWYALYRTRLELDRRWDGSSLVPVPAPSPAPSFNNVPPYPHPYPWGHQVPYPRASPVAYTMVPQYPKAPKRIPFAPQILSIEGHTDSVYCIEFDSKRIVTGSRDRTIKVWSLKDGRLLGSFGGGSPEGHTGSVLCLKFSGDWDCDEGDDDDYGNNKKQGFMVSGSSDHSVCVWNLWTGSRVGEEGDRKVKGELRSILRGHLGGVLDLRIDDHWIVSCSKDTVVRVWDRDTLEPVRVLRGHEGPVNSVGLQNGRVVSASGDGKMILWDITSGERIRTFDGHDRGLACIEFKDGVIVSGSNDCKIKVWNAETGECVRTLLGHEALVRALSFDSKSGRLVSASYDKAVKIWDLKSGKLVREFKNTHTSHIFDVKFDAARIVSTSHDHKIVIIDFSQGLDTSLFI